MVAALALVPLLSDGYPLVLLTDVLVFALFAVSLHFLIGPGGMVSFGHAAYFGLGAYAAALLFLRWQLPMELALLRGAAGGDGRRGAVRLVLRAPLRRSISAMLTLAFAQIVWSIAFQWDARDRRLERPGRHLAGAVAFVAGRPTTSSRSRFARRRSPAYGGSSARPSAMRCARAATRRCAREAIGIDVRAQQWAAFIVAGTFAGLAGALFAFSKGSISPETLSVPRSVDGLVMVMLGGVQTLTGPVWGAALFTWLEDAVSREVAYWRAAIGAVILLLGARVSAGY